MAVFVAVFCVGKYSGAHLNPAVSVAMAIVKRITIGQLATYILAQMLGAIAGATVVWLFYKEHFRVTDDPDAKLACFSTGTFFCAATWLGFAGVSGVETSGFAVLRKKTSRNVTIPATSTRAEIHGAMRAKRRALFRRAGYADTHSE